MKNLSLLWKQNKEQISRAIAMLSFSCSPLENAKSDITVIKGHFYDYFHYRRIPLQN